MPPGKEEKRWIEDLEVTFTKPDGNDISWTWEKADGSSGETTVLGNGTVHFEFTDVVEGLDGWVKMDAEGGVIERLETPRPGYYQLGRATD